jgi:DNA-directed RNA polymerase specialized sigma24 family protein
MPKFPEPLALQIWRMYQQGLNFHEIAEELGLPPDRVRARIAAVARVSRWTQVGPHDPVSSPPEANPVQ